MGELCALSPRSGRAAPVRAEAYPVINNNVNGISSDPTSVRRLPARLTGWAAVGLLLVASTSPGHAQAPILGGVATFAVLGGSTVTNTGATVLTGTAALPGNLGVAQAARSPGFSQSTADLAFCVATRTDPVS
jgi:hypothetical protein